MCLSQSTAVTAPLREQLDQFQAMFGEAKKRTAETIADANRKRLSAKLPDLAKNDRAWSSIQAEVFDAFDDDPSRYATPEEAFDDVFQSRYGAVLSALSKAAEEEEDADTKAQVAASSMTTPGVKTKPKPSTPLDAAYAAFKHLSSGDPEDAEGARRAFHRALRT
jgi:hypothetical protein